MKKQNLLDPLTAESVLASLLATERMLKEKYAEDRLYFIERDKKAEQERKEREQESKEREQKAEQERKEREQKAEQERKEREQERKEYDRRMKKMEERMGSWSNNHGFFAEEYFFNSFDQNRRDFFGEQFDEIEPNLKGIKKGFRDEYDIVLINGKSVGIVEVKYKAHENDVPKVLRKAETFRVNFPEFENHKIYLGLATFAFYDELEDACTKNGIAIVKQVGDTVVINDAHLKVY